MKLLAVLLLVTFSNVPYLPVGSVSVSRNFSSFYLIMATPELKRNGNKHILRIKILTNLCL